MEVGKKLKEARVCAQLTQDQVAKEIYVSRQTISNWENEKFYPDIISLIRLSDLYSVSLDTLLKGDSKLMSHLEESTNVVKSNKNLIRAISMNIILFIIIVILRIMIPMNEYYMIGIFCLFIISSTVLFYEIIKKF